MGSVFKCQETGHIAKDCLARVLPHPSQTGKSEDSKEADGGEKSAMVLYSQALSGWKTLDMNVSPTIIRKC